MVIKMSKIAHLSYFLLMAAKNQSHFEQKVQVHLRDVILVFFWKMLRLGFELPLARCQNVFADSVGFF